ncbi:stage V sporulation protein D [Iocasia frigidifontis]|uniref:Stage V sporulation protein D n=1 Tax=Iocasia fonsfrigidae TaxID=2682810 RepID=A0A8A7K8G5_9FIRM|nr:stage V sporulation protein D [Iocasia fonsfrigidae]QTL98036.1 stage V sporulation protein D [Iocasia fonsfrigidae]
MANLPHLKVKKRIIALFLIFFLLIIILGLRLFWIQVISSEKYQEKALDQRLRQLKVEPKRGIIYDRNGRQLAISASSETLVAIPNEIEEPEKTARKLAQVLSIDYDYIYERITRRASAVYIKRKLDETLAQQVRQLDLKGITFTEESKRYYPKDNLASHLLGFAGIDSQGLDGLELSYDKYLRGIPGKIQSERDARGESIPDGIREYVPPQNGYNVYLTIDEVIQYIIERELDRAVEEFNISGGTIIVMNPKTGEIMAMANRPDYNPNDFANYPQKYWRNRAISDIYEPGSTFKIITTASALEDGVVNENDVFVDPGYIKVSDRRINCWKAGGHGRQTFADVVKNSCNVGFVQVGMRLGKESFYNYINSFGFGSETSIKLPGEAKGLLYDFDSIGPVELATMSFGHGISVTPIQLITAVSAVANNGMLLRPRFVKEIRNADDELVEEFQAVPIRQVVSEETAQRTLKLLERVVAEGTGISAAIEGYRIGGKTGTAEHYGAQIYDSSFIGILPIDDPQMVILTVLYDLKGFPYYASQTAAPIFRNVAQDILRYLEIPPQIIPEEGEEEKRNVTVPDVEGLTVIEAERILRKNKFDVKLIGGSDKIIKQIPLAGADILEGSTVLLLTEQAQGIEKKYYVAVPDLSGLTGEKAANLLAELGLVLVPSGEGVIIKQDIEPGERVPGGSKISVILKEDG